MTALYLVELWVLCSVLACILIGRGINILYNAEEHGLKADPFSGHLFAFRARKGEPDQGPLVGWDLPLSLHETPRRQGLPLAFGRGCGRGGRAQPGATLGASGGDRLACTGAALATGRLRLRCPAAD